MSKKMALSPAPPSTTLFRRRHMIGYLLCVALTVGLFIAATRYYRERIDTFQITRERYAAERALAALEAGDAEAAKREVQLLETEAPIGITDRLFFRRPFSNVEEGPVLRNRVMIYERLTAALMDAKMLEEAEIVGWKTLMEYHVVSRTIELIAPWHLMYYIKLGRGDWTSFFECSKILAAHGVDRVVQPGDMEPIAFPVDESAFAGNTAVVPGSMGGIMKIFYAAERPQEFGSSATSLDSLRNATANPILRRRINDLRHRALIAGGDRVGARRLLAEVWGRDPSIMDPFWAAWPTAVPIMELTDRDPTLMEYLWRDRPDDSRVKLTSFVDSFSGDARVQIETLQKAQEFQTGFFQPGNRMIKLPDEILLAQSVGITLDVTLEEPARRLFLAFTSSVALGVHPILMLRIDDQPPIPLYCDSTEPALLPIDVDIAPGTHRFEIVYLNDSGFGWASREIKEDRNIALQRLVLVHAQPRI